MPKLNGVPSNDYVPIELRNDGLYEFTCTNGHRALTVLQEQKFEILFEIGAYAILDGYYREAVSSFSAALERFYEFSLSVFCMKAGVQDEEWSKSWKIVAAQSERQFGAFVFLHSAILGTSPSVPAGKWREFRNDVVHKGRIPTRHEALEYGEVVRLLLQSGTATIRENFQEQMHQAIFKHLKASSAGAPIGVQVATMSTTTTVSLTRAAAAEKKMPEVLEDLRTRRPIVG
ncbi:hypothetical protein [Pseudorhodoferax soli]|uniref:Uncharacterized protein n=1 Tax=Pseudorhodoferax soli TaxID=545864 RepID=A0A368XM60_9BURK|nr:hypothetical protein [Pseudorhodoferax soli]RCW68128.1 hypothetical protein DES41_108310 [Pseudorhodoferax soli]